MSHASICECSECATRKMAGGGVNYGGVLVPRPPTQDEVLAELRREAAGLKHGPGGSGLLGPCDPTCRKCEIELRARAAWETSEISGGRAARDADDLLRRGLLPAEVPRGPVVHEPGIAIESDYATLGDVMSCRVVGAVLVDGSTHALKLRSDDGKQYVVWWDRNACRWAFSYIGVYGP